MVTGSALVAWLYCGDAIKVASQSLEILKKHTFLWAGAIFVNNGACWQFNLKWYVGTHKSNKQMLKVLEHFNSINKYQMKLR